MSPRRPNPRRYEVRVWCHGHRTYHPASLFHADHRVGASDRHYTQPVCKEWKATLNRKSHLEREHGIPQPLALHCFYDVQGQVCPVCGEALSWAEFVVHHRRHTEPLEERIAFVHDPCNKKGAEAYPEAWAVMHRDPPLRRANGGQPVFPYGYEEPQIPILGLP